jgi:hypothetical protein
MRLEIVGKFTVNIDVTPDGAVVFTVRPVQPAAQPAERELLRNHVEQGFRQLARDAGILAGPVITQRLVDAWIALTSMRQVTPVELAPRVGVSKQYAEKLLGWLVRMGLAVRSNGRYSPSSSLTSPA